MHTRRAIGRFAVLAIISVAVWLVWPQRKLPTAILANGSKVTLRKITAGPKHVFRYATGWQEVVYPILPRMLQAKLHPRQLEYETSSDELMLWLQLDDPPATLTNGASFSFSIVDQNGLETATDGLEWHTQFPLPPTVSIGQSRGRTFSGRTINQFPRRQKQFHLRLYEIDSQFDRKFVRDFLTTNPLKQISVTELIPEKLPVTHQTNGLEITLVRLETGFRESDLPAQPFLGSTKDARTLSRATLQVTEQGQRGVKWSISNVRLQSASGDEYYGHRTVAVGGPEFLQNGNRSAEVLYDFQGPLWLEEPAWTLDLDLIRREPYAANELWVIKNVRVPKDDEIVEAPQTVMRGKLQFEFLGISGTNVPLSQTYPTELGAKLHLRIPDHMEDWAVAVVAVRDERLQKVELGGYEVTLGDSQTDSRLRGIALKIPDGAKSLDFTIAVTQVHHVQFTAKPVLFVPDKKTGN